MLYKKKETEEETFANAPFITLQLSCVENSFELDSPLFTQHMGP